VYIDTSVAVKLYVEEPDTPGCIAAARHARLASSRLLFCEFRSALLRKLQQSAISAELHSDVWRQFQRDVEAARLTLISIDDALVEDAARLLAALHPDVPLRTLDALHLATCLGVDAGPLFTRDARMLRAAQMMGMPLAG
jgi:predicted nucleic acid-binding protein